MNQLFFLLLSGCTIFLPHQENCLIKKGSAYFRSTIPGHVSKKTLDESGKEIDRPIKKMSTYFFYIELNKDCNIQVSKIWVDGKAYKVNQEEITKTPVIIQPSYPGTHPDTLVMLTSNKVLRLQQKELLQIKPDKKTTNKLNGAKVLVEYNGKSRTEYYSIKEIKRLVPLVLQ